MTRKRGAAPPTQSLGESLRREMARRGINQVEMAEELGVVKQTVHDWLSGRRSPSSRHAGAIGKFLAMPTDEVLALIQGSRNPDRLAQLETLVTELQEKVRRLERAQRARTKAAGDGH